MRTALALGAVFFALATLPILGRAESASGLRSRIVLTAAAAAAFFLIGARAA